MSQVRRTTRARRPLVVARAGGQTSTGSECGWRVGHARCNVSFGPSTPNTLVEFMDGEGFLSIVGGMQPEGTHGGTRWRRL